MFSNLSVQFFFIIELAPNQIFDTSLIFGLIFLSENMAKDRKKNIVKHWEHQLNETMILSSETHNGSREKKGAILFVVNELHNHTKENKEAIQT